MNVSYVEIDAQTYRVVRRGETSEGTFEQKKEEAPGVVAVPLDMEVEMGMFYDTETYSFRYPTAYELPFEPPTTAAVGEEFTLPLAPDMVCDPPLPYIPSEPGIFVCTIRRRGYEDKQFIVSAQGKSEARRATYPTLEEFADAVYWERRGRPEVMENYLARIDEVKRSIPK